MFRFALKQLRYDPVRTGLSALAVGAVIALVLVFEGFRLGVLEDLRQFPGSLPVDLVVMQEGVENFTAVRSSLRQLSRKEVESIAGVKEAHPVVNFPVIFEWKEHRLPIQMVVYDTLGGPPEIVGGKGIDGGRQMVMDARLATYLGLEPGTEVALFDYEFVVVGLADGSQSPFAPYVFVTFDDLIDLYFEADLPISGDIAPLLGALLVEVNESAEVGVIRSAIEDTIDDVDVFTPSELGENDAAFGERLLGPALNLLVGIAWVIAVLTMSLMLHANARAKLREFAVVKAIGATPTDLAATMMVSAISVALLATPVGLLIVVGIADIVSQRSPLFSVQPWEWSVIGRALTASYAAALVGVLPAWSLIAKVDPDTVFRGGN